MKYTVHRCHTFLVVNIPYIVQFFCCNDDIFCQKIVYQSQLLLIFIQNLKTKILLNLMYVYFFPIWNLQNISLWKSAEPYSYSEIERWFYSKQL